MYLTLIWVLQIPTSMCLDIEGLGSLSDDEISLNISKYITTLNSRLESTVGVSDANSTFTHSFDDSIEFCETCVLILKRRYLKTVAVFRSTHHYFIKQLIPLVKTTDNESCD